MILVKRTLMMALIMVSSNAGENVCYLNQGYRRFKFTTSARKPYGSVTLSGFKTLLGSINHRLTLIVTDSMRVSLNKLSAVIN